MAAKRRDTSAATVRGDEDALDPVEARDIDTVEGDELEEAGLSELDDDAFEEDELDEDELEQDDGDGDVDVDVDAEGDAADVLPEGEDLDEVATAVPAEAAFDEEDEALVVAAVVGDNDEDDDVEGIRDGEFVCRSCYMAKRDTQLADADRTLCRDCA